MIKLNKASIKFASVTNALRAKEAIEAEGGNVTIVRNTVRTKGEGCGYSLIVSGKTDRIPTLLKSHRINFIGYTNL